MNLRLLIKIFVLTIFFLITSHMSWAAYQSRFDAVNFDPAIDGGDYFTIYGSQTLKAWQGTMGFYFDYANHPLEFRSTGGVAGRQSVLDHTFILNTYGSLGFTDWFMAGINIPFALYAAYFTDDVAAMADKGFSMGDLSFMTKFRIINIDRAHVGLSLIPFVTFPTGDVVRYMGSGHVTGGMRLVFDAQLHRRFGFSLNVAGLLRDDVTRNYTFAGGATSTVRVDDILSYGLGMNYKVSEHFELIAEASGATVMRDLFATRNVTSLETSGGVRWNIGDSGFSLDAGGGAGLIEGVGTPKFRGIMGLKWRSPGVAKAPPPDPRIKDNKIVLWGKIFFDTARATIKPMSFPVLDDVVDVLNRNPAITLVEIQGHTDMRGGDSYNLNLSQKRAESTRQYLIDKGIDAGRLVAKGYGESQPLAANDTVEGMSQNRRVEFVILQSADGHVTPAAPAVSTPPVVVDAPVEPEVEAPKVETPPKVEMPEVEANPETPPETQAPQTTGDSADAPPQTSDATKLTEQKDKEGNYLPNYSGD